MTLESLKNPFAVRLTKHAFTKYKKQASMFFAFGISAVIFEALAFVTIWIGFSQIDSKGKDLPFSEALQGLSPVTVTIIGVGIVVGLLFLSALSFYLLGNRMAHFRRYSFEAASLDLLAKLNSNMASPYIEKNGAKAISRALRRDCRYISKSLGMLLIIPRFLLVLILALVAGLFSFPKITGVAILIIVLSLPFHMFAARHGISAMDRILSSSRSKSQNDLGTVRQVYASNFRTGSKEETLTILENYKNSESTQAFLEAYGDRINLGPLSQFVSRMTGMVLFAVLAGIIYFDYAAGKISISEMFLIVIVFRFGFRALMNLASNVVNVVSYKPLVEETVEFLYGDDAALEAEPTSKPFEFNPPIDEFDYLIGLIGVSDVNWFFASKLYDAMECDQTNIRLLVSDDEPPAELSKEYPKMLAGLLRGRWKNLSAITKDHLKAAKKKDAEVPLHIRALKVLALTYKEPDIKVNLWESKAFASLPIHDKNVIVSSLGGQKVLICYPKPPKRFSEDFWEGFYSFNPETSTFEPFTIPAK